MKALKQFWTRLHHGVKFSKEEKITLLEVIAFQGNGNEPVFNRVEKYFWKVVIPKEDNSMLK